MAHVYLFPNGNYIEVWATLGVSIPLWRGTRRAYQTINSGGRDDVPNNTETRVTQRIIGVHLTDLQNQLLVLCFSEEEVERSTDVTECFYHTGQDLIVSGLNEAQRFLDESWKK